MPEFQKWLLLFQSLGFAAVLLRLLTSGLWRTYRFFFGYLVFSCAQAGIPLAVNPKAGLYLRLFLFSEAIILGFYTLIILELYSIVLKDLPGIASRAKRYTKIVLACAIGVSILILEAEKVPSNKMQQFLTIERTIVSSVVVFVFLITAFLLYYPVPLNRNAVYYSIGYAVYFTSKTSVLFIWNTSHEFYRILSLVMLGISALCLFFWGAVLSRGGEAKKATVGHQWNPGDDQRLLRQLEAINARLVQTRE